MSTDADINAVAIRLPEFQSHDPTTFFFHAEAQFELRNITQDRTKFNHVIASLPSNAINKVRDLIRKPPANAYDKLKDMLLARASQLN